MIISGIYQILNKVNGKSYIGSSKDIPKRWAQHLFQLASNCHHNIILQRAWKKYGMGAFEFNILERTADLFARESYFIDLLKPKYNLGSVGGGDNVSKHPKLAEIREKHSKNGKARWAAKTKEERRAYAEKMKGDGNPNWRGGICTPACSACGKTLTYGHLKCSKCSKIGKSNPFFGKTHSVETKAKLAEVSKGRKPANSRPVLIEGKIYPSATQAGRELEVCTATILFRIKSKHWDYSYN